MRFTTSLRLWVCAVAVSVCNAQISKPRAGDVLMPNQQFEVEWQTAGLQAPINVDLVPSGKTDLSLIAEKIAVQVDNVGRLNWNPSASITAFESFAIVITDSAQAVVVSEPFKITQLTQQPVVQTILGADPAQVEILTAAAGPPKVVYSGALPAEAIPAGVAEAEAAPTEPALVQPEESRNTISNGTAPGASPSRQRTGKSKKQPATPNEDAVPRNSSKPLTSIAEKNQTPTPIYSTIQSAPSAPASFPTLSATKNQTGVPGRGAEVTPTPIYSTIPDSGPAFPSLSVTKNQTAPANAEVTPTPIYSTLPDTLSKFPTLAPTNNQTAPSAEQPAKSKAPAATQPAIEVPANRTSITPEAPTTPSLPIVTLPVPKNSTIPASSPATSAPPVLPSAANPASNSSATPTGLPALPVTEPAAVAPVPIAAPSAPSSPPSDGTGTAVTKPEPQTSDPAAAAPSAASSSGALPYKGTLPADGGAVKSDVPASTTGGPTDTASGVSVTPVPSTTAGGGKESGKGGDKSGDESGGSGSGSGKGSGQDSDTESDSESGSGSGSGSGSSSISGSNTGVRQPSTSVSSTAAIVPTPQPQLGVGIGATPVVQIGPSITLPSSLWTSMILETAAGFAAPSGGSFAVATSPALLTVPNAGCRTTQGGGYVAAVLGAVTALLVVVM
ncbi:hypothetical protein CTAM01_00101 [Colletotrichum tamarilloi]|uniref:Uncharacterized protein n=1 Tax=Colletotrichum tamarilloi TaxID=1209934 RepID=A0ABQ9RTM0_9PEZI|nr:uncharacterized protein CTAM01_00101 [Colletotrichum tamarilloi]KAK1512706.1 hypothetical protein CTAM01_00101 [Colletotrichum tamarilloi]